MLDVGATLDLPPSNKIMRFTNDIFQRFCNGLLFFYILYKAFNHRYCKTVSNIANGNTAYSKMIFNYCS